MNRTELIVVVSAVLLIAFMLGWSARWLLHKFNRVSTANVADLDHMASALHDAEEARDQAMAYVEDREAELTNRLSQTEAELETAMDGLGEARREAQELRSYISENSRSDTA